METQIINDGACIRLVNGDTAFLICKAQIRTIDTYRNEGVSIAIGEGALRNIYIRHADVTVPAELQDVAALRDAIKAMLDSAGTDLSSLNGGLDNVKTSVDVVAQNVTAAGQSLAGVLGTLKTSVDATSQQITGVRTALDALAQNQAAQLQSIITALGQIKDVLYGANYYYNQPLRVDEATPGVVYYGYALPEANGPASGPGSDEPVWAIMRVTRNGEIYSYMWVNGNRDFVNVWYDRYNQAYLPLVH